jgi:hypothetical protein
MAPVNTGAVSAAPGFAASCVSVTRPLPVLTKPIVPVAGVVGSTTPLLLSAPIAMVPPFTCTRSRPSAAVAVIDAEVTASNARLSRLPFSITWTRSLSDCEGSKDRPRLIAAVALPVTCEAPFSTRPAPPTWASIA